LGKAEAYGYSEEGRLEAQADESSTAKEAVGHDEGTLGGEEKVSLASSGPASSL
jgi:hypothetical protein